MSEKFDQMLGHLVTDPYSSGAVLPLLEAGMEWMERIELLVGWRKRAPKMEGALQQECLLWVPLCQARALSLVPSGSTAGLLSAVRGEIIIIEHSSKHSPNSASFSPPNNPVT